MVRTNEYTMKVKETRRQLGNALFVEINDKMVAKTRVIHYNITIND